MTLQGVFLWFYWVCYVLIWGVNLVERDEKIPFGLRVAMVTTYGAGAIGMLVYLTRAAVPGTAPVGWLLLAGVVITTIVNDIRWYVELMKKQEPVPLIVRQMATVFGCVGDFVVQMPCMVMLYRLARGMVPP